jgi:hypothetical protein
MTVCHRWKATKTSSDFIGQVNDEFNERFQTFFKKIGFNVRQGRLCITDVRG